MTPTTTARCAIIAGGQGSRMDGAPKGLLEVGGRTILERIIAAATPIFSDPPLLIANAPEAGSWAPGLRVLPDAVPNAGVLGGLLTAIIAAPAPVVCVAWDMPFVTPNLLERLATGYGDFDVLAPESHGPRGLEPLCATYGPGSAEPIAAAIIGRDFRATGFHPRIRLGKVPLTEIQALGDPNRLFFNVNTPSDLERAQSLAESEGSRP